MKTKPCFYIILAAAWTLWAHGNTGAAERENLPQGNMAQSVNQYNPQQLECAEQKFLWNKAQSDAGKRLFLAKHNTKFAAENKCLYYTSDKIKFLVKTIACVASLLLITSPEPKIDTLLIFISVAFGTYVTIQYFLIRRILFEMANDDEIKRADKIYRLPPELWEAKLMSECLGDIDYKKYLPTPEAPILNKACEGIQVVLGNFLGGRTELVRQGILQPLKSQQQMFEAFAQWGIIRPKDIDVYYQAIILKQWADS